ncbi:putative transmembrane protein [Rhizoctonia solani 123E]|uniref:Putative transmembrane protein n=1 Tax=Rhizoctonia solani 123E TaxID=1423351 RepID=A0A074S5R0_9AGAM|nr:putative transmembrane protein [Rhizoctonia solani 123E]
MVNWSDPATMMAQAAVFAQILWVLLGIIGWEFITTLDFEYRTIKKWREFKWPMAFYFMCRYSIFIALVVLNVINNTKTEINCQAMYTLAQFLGNVSIGTASNLLMFRAIAIWSRNTWVVVPLVLVALGHWSILLHGIIAVRATWNATVGVCVVTGTSNIFLRLLYNYTMAFDLLVLILSVAGLTRGGNGRESGLWSLLFKDGIAYFTVAFVGNLIAAIFAILHLNAAMDIMFTVPAAVFSAIVAMRCVRRLSDWAGKDVYVHSSERTAGSSRQRASPGKKVNATGPGVAINMETYSNTADVQFYRSDSTTVDLEQATEFHSVDGIADEDHDKKYPQQTSFMPLH